MTTAIDIHEHKTSTEKYTVSIRVGSNFGTPWIRPGFSVSTSYAGTILSNIDYRDAIRAKQTLEAASSFEEQQSALALIRSELTNR